jgi:Condensation domain
VTEVHQAPAASDVRGLISRLESLPVHRRQAAVALLEERGADFNIFPLSPAQFRIWLSSLLYGHVPLYNVSLAYRFTGQLDVTMFSRALQEMVQRHEMLRTVFFEVDGKPYQAILPELTIPLKVGRLPGTGQEREDFVRRVFDAEARHPIDARRGPLVRNILLASPEDGDHLFVHTMHHILSDGWSHGVLFRDLGEVYSALVEGRPPELPPLKARYVDFARWQARHLRGAEVQEQLRFWVEHLRGAPPLLQIPGDRPRPANQTFEGEMESVTWPRPLLEALSAFCRRENMTLFVALMAAFYALLHRWTGRDDLVLGTPYANRDRPETEDLMGFFVNTLALRIRLTEHMRFRELLGRVRELAFTAQGNQDIPFESLVDALKPDRSANHHPVFQVAFTVQDGSSVALQLTGARCQFLLGHNGTCKFDLTMHFMALADGLRGLIEYDTAQFDRSRILRMLADMHAIVLAVIADPEIEIAQLPIGT